jgi:hypothetical protein
MKGDPFMTPEDLKRAAQNRRRQIVIYPTTAEETDDSRQQRRRSASAQKSVTMPVKSAKQKQTWDPVAKKFTFYY